jgi:tetratricopeptide (TPR) repeat protein
METGLELWHRARYNESIKSFKAANEMDVVKTKYPADLAMMKRRIAEVYLGMGQLEEADRYSEEAIITWPSNDDERIHAVVEKLYEIEICPPPYDYSRYEEVNTRVIRAHVLHHMGRPLESERVFLEAEDLQQKRGDGQYLYGIFALWFLNLLLDQAKQHPEKLEEARKRAEASCKLGHTDILKDAVDVLMTGRIALLEDDLRKAEVDLREAERRLRKAAQLPHIPYGLLALAQFYLRTDRTDALDNAEKVLKEAKNLTEHYEMKLHRADCYLCYVRYYLKRGEAKEAHTYLVKAMDLIHGTKYKRRYEVWKELAELVTERL